MVRVGFRPEAELTLFLRMRTKETPKHSKMYSDRRVIPPLRRSPFPIYRKWGSPKRTARSDFWPEARR